MLRYAIALSVGALLAGAAEASAPVSTTNRFRPLNTPGIENFYSVGKRLYSGSTPEGEAAFDALARLGIKTIISVDGAKPDVERAARHGLRYVHLPIGYDGVPAAKAALLVKAATTFPGSIYVHCHHGRHRGPAAVAAICRSIEDWSPQAAADWLRAAGTATNYAGLYKTVAEFRPPGAEELKNLPSTFPSRAETAGLVESMVKMDEHFDALKAAAKAGFRPNPGDPGLAPVNQALLLWEALREAHRARTGGERGGGYLAEMARAEAAAGELHARLKGLAADSSPSRRAAADTAFQSVAKSCASCHKAFRD